MMITLGCGQIGAGILVNPTEYAIYFRNLEDKTCFHHEEVQSRYISLGVRVS